MCILQTRWRTMEALVGILLVAGPRVAAARTAPGEVGPGDLAAAKERANAGKLAADSGDFAGAIGEYRRAHELVPAGPQYDIYRARTLLGRVLAHRRLYAQSSRREDLCDAKESLEQLLDDLPEALADHRAELESMQQDVVKRCSPPIPPVTEPGPTETKVKPPEEPGSTLHDSPGPEPLPRARPMLVSGAVLTGLGVASLAGMAAGLVLGAQANEVFDAIDRAGNPNRDGVQVFNQGQAADRLAISMGVAGGVLTVTGAALVAIGVKRRAGARRAMILPAFGPRSATVALYLVF